MDYGKFLTGAVMASSKTDAVTIEIADVRTTSYGREVIDFKDPVLGEYSSLPLNQTNTLRLRRLFGRDREGWIDGCIELKRYITRNPKTEQDAWGIYVEDGTGAPDATQFGRNGAAAAQTKRQPARLAAPVTAASKSRGKKSE